MIDQDVLMDLSQICSKFCPKWFPKVSPTVELQLSGYSVNQTTQMTPLLE